MGTEKDNVTTFEVRVSISNEKRMLKAQMTANAEIILEEQKGVLAIPEGAIVYNKDKHHGRDSRSHHEKGMKSWPITTGISNGAKTEVLSGLTDGQQVSCNKRYDLSAANYSGRCREACSATSCAAFSPWPESRGALPPSS